MTFASLTIFTCFAFLLLKLKREFTNSGYLLVIGWHRSDTGSQFSSQFVVPSIDESIVFVQ